MLTVVQGCIDCQTPMIDMEKWGNCPNCSSRNIGPITLGEEKKSSKQQSKVTTESRFYELKFNNGGQQKTVIYVKAKNTTDARMMLYFWCEKEGKLLLSSTGDDIRFMPRTTKSQKNSFGKTLTQEINARLYRGGSPAEYLTHNAHRVIVRKHLIAA